MATGVSVTTDLTQAEIYRHYHRGYQAGMSAARRYASRIDFNEIWQRGLDADVFERIVADIQASLDKQIEDLYLLRRLVAREEMTLEELTKVAHVVLQPHIQKLLNSNIEDQRRSE